MGNDTVAGPSPMSVRTALDCFLSSPRCKNPNTRRAYGAALDKVADRIGPDRPLAAGHAPRAGRRARGALGSVRARHLESASRGHRFVPHLVREELHPRPDAARVGGARPKTRP